MAFDYRERLKNGFSKFSVAHSQPSTDLSKTGSIKCKKRVLLGSSVDVVGKCGVVLSPLLHIIDLVVPRQNSDVCGVDGFFCTTSWMIVMGERIEIGLEGPTPIQ